MSKFIDRPRYSCALGGALNTLRAIPRAIPIIHASSGCGYNLYNASNSGSAYLGGGYCGASSLPSSNIIEKDVVFGGESRLKEQIKSTLEIMDGDIYIVVTGCMVEMIGDDIDSVVNEFSNYEKPVIAISTPSFRGNSYYGYDLVFEEFVKKCVIKNSNKKTNKVNILGIIPGQDVFWKGNLKEIKRILNLLDLEVNTFFGENENFEDIKSSGDASLNIVLSDIYGALTAKAYENEHNIPYIRRELPIGYIETEKFLREIGDYFNIDKTKINMVIEKEREIYYDYFERIIDIYNDVDLQRYSIVVADANYASSLTRFISDELGWLPELVVITDIVKEDEKNNIIKRFEGLESGLKPAVKFDTDTSSVKKYIKEIWKPNRNEKYYDSLGPTVILGSVFERELSKEFNYPLVTVSYPITNRIVLNRAYAGFNGGLILTEDILTTLVSGR